MASENQSTVQQNIIPLYCLNESIRLLRQCTGHFVVCCTYLILFFYFFFRTTKQPAAAMYLFFFAHHIVSWSF